MEEIFRQRLLEEIKHSGMEVKEIAEKVGVTPSIITQYYTSKKLPKLDTFYKLCKVLEVSSDYMLGLDTK